MEGQVLANNARMLSLMHSLNFGVGPDPGDASVKRVEIALNGPRAGWPAEQSIDWQLVI